MTTKKMNLQDWQQVRKNWEQAGSPKGQHAGSMPVDFLNAKADALELVKEFQQDNNKIRARATQEAPRKSLRL